MSLLSGKRLPMRAVMLRLSRFPVTLEILASGWILFGVVPFLGLHRLIADPDLFWHLAAGRTGLLLRQDPFSFSASGAPWLNQSWLWQAIVWPLFRRGGFPALLTLSTLVFGLIALCLLASVGAGAAPLEAWILPVAASLSLIAAAADPRAQFVGLLLLALLVWGCPVGKPARIPPLALLPFFAFWANVHSSFLLGEIWVAALWMESERRHKRHHEERTPHRLRLALAFAIMGGLLTPWGGRLWTYPIYATLHPFTSQFIAEFRPLPRAAWPLIASLDFLLAGVALLPLRSGKPLPLIPLLITLLAGAAAIRSAVYTPYFAIMAAPQVATQIGAWLARRGATPSLEDTSLVGGAAWEPPLYRLGLIALAPLLINCLPRIRPPSDPVDRNLLPVSAALKMQRMRLKGNVFNYFDWGGYLIFTQHPRMKVYVDGRAETVYPLTVLDSCRRAEKGDRKQAEAMAKRADWALWPANHPMARILKDSPDWELVFVRDGAALFRSHVRSTATR